MTPNHIFVKDLEGRFTLVNRTLAEAHCRRIEDLIGKTAEKFIPDAGVAKNLRHEDLEVIRTSREQFLAEAKLTTATGQVRWLQLVKCPLFDQNGKVSQVLGVGTDITQLRATKEAAESASRANSEFVANMSHEIRTARLQDQNQSRTKVTSKVERGASAMRPADTGAINEGSGTGNAGASNPTNPYPGC